MARGRKAKKNRRRSAKPMIKVLPILSGLLSADAATKMFFGTNIKEFLIGGLGQQGNPYVSTAGGGTSFSQAITLPELFGYVTSNLGSPMGIAPPNTLPSMIMANMQQNIIPSALQFGAAAAIPKILTKTGVSRNANKLLKGFGLGGVVQL